MVTEFCARGSLYDVLGKARASQQLAVQLDWPKRLNMALDAAKVGSVPSGSTCCLSLPLCLWTGPGSCSCHVPSQLAQVCVVILHARPNFQTRSNQF